MSHKKFSDISIIGSRFDRQADALMLMIFLLFLLAAGIAGVILLRPQSRRPLTPPTNADAFRAVSITFDQAEACAAVRELALRRFLCSEAPMLPLPECAAAACECRFERHDDRRLGPRRADETGVFQPIYDGENQRTERRGRRAEDRGDESPAPAPEAESFDPTATYYDFIAQTGIRPEGSK